jgi:Domain of Unknown Function (DUF1259)
LRRIAVHPIIRLVAPLAATVALATPGFAAEPDWNQVAQALGKSGAMWAGGVYRVGFPRTDLNVSLDGVALRTGFAFGGWLAFQFGIPRAQPVTDQGMALPGAMGAAIAINFQPTGFNTAAITGDFVLLASEVNPVIKALQANGIEITALHSHMLDEQPRVFFLHFWANDDAQKLATGLRAALDKVDVKKEAASAR